MRILFLLTLNGLTLGLSFDHVCNGRVNGVFATSLCSTEYNQCFNGQLTTKICPFGLVFNADSSQCDFGTNVVGCAGLDKISCEHRQDGSYSIGCSPSFFFCSNGILHQSKCPHELYYDGDRELCDHKFRVRACGGHPQVEREPVTRSPVLVPTYTPRTLAYRKVNGHEHKPTDVVINCEGRANGAYQIGKCVQQYVTCTDGVWELVKCVANNVFAEGACLPYYVVSDCVPLSSSRALETDSIEFNCSNRQNGYYGPGCTKDFFSCSGGVLRMMKCPSSLVFNETKGYCDYPTEECTSEVSSNPSSSPARAIHSQSFSMTEVDTSIGYCKGREDGYYSKGCSNEFVSCVKEDTLVMNCPPELVFNNKKGYCDYVENCSDVGKVHQAQIAHMGTTPATTKSSKISSTNVDCQGKNNGYYGQCSSEFVYCNEGVAVYMKCPSALVFNEKSGHCDSVENCSRDDEVNSASAAHVNTVAHGLKIQATSGDCEGKKEGYYAIQCSSKFVYCSNEGVATHMKCPAALVYNENKGYCDYPESCSGTSKNQSHPLEPLVRGTVVHQIDCSTLPDGRYGLQCSPTFTVCSDGVSSSMRCAEKLVFNAKDNRCSPIHECDKENTLQEGVAGAPKYFFTKVSRNECVNKTDGLHSLGCISVFLQCVDGIAYNVYCPTGLVFVENLGVCDFPYACSQLQNRKVASLPTSYEAVIGDGNIDSKYEADCDVDGYFSRKCSAEYFNCVGGKKFVGVCPVGMVFIVERTYCDHPERCLRGELDFNPDAQAVPTTIIDKSFSCMHRADGVVMDLDCQPLFMTCLNGTALVTSCPHGLLYSVTSKLCDHPESCELNSVNNTKSSISHTESKTFPIHPTSTISPKSYPLPSLASVAYHGTAVGAHLCSNRVDGPLNSTDCRSSFSFCAHGSLYSIGCADGLVYSFASRRCEWPSLCGSYLEDVVSSATPVQVSSTSAECTASIALGNCSSVFKRCKEGKLITAYCPERSLFDNDLLLCVYDMPKCQRNHPTIEYPLEATVAPDFSTTSTMYAVPVVPSNPPYQSQYFLPISSQNYHAFDSSMRNPFAANYPEYIPFAVHDSMFRRGKVVHGPIKFEERSILAGNRRQKIFDVFDGYVSPWLWHGIDRVFVPNPYRRHKHHNSGLQSDEENGDSGLLDDNKINLDELASEDKAEHVEHDEIDNDDALQNDVITAQHKDQSTEGSGENMLLRRRRNSQNHKMGDFSKCTTSTSPGFLAIEFCSQNFVFCRSVGAGVLAACPVGDLFDNTTKKCITSTFCAKSESLPNSQQQVPQHRTASLEDRTTTTFRNEQACSDYALDCKGNFMKCVHGRFQPMKCPEGLVFDRMSSQCNYPHAVEICKESARIKYDVKYPTDRTSTGDTIVPIISNAAIDHRKESSTQPQNVLDAVSARLLSKSCLPQPFARCSSKYFNCSKGIFTELHCATSLVFNPVTMTCEYREAVPECQSFEEEASTYSNAALSCVYNEKRPVFALDFCGRTYGVCSKQGILRREECSVGFLFDSHLDTCVPAEQCGQERLKDLLSKMMPTPPNFGIQTAERFFNSEKRKDDRCRNTAEGALKPLGRCRSSYIKCVDGKAVIEQCSTTAEVFSSAVGMCVMRINAPECHDKPQREHLPQLTISGDPTTFCKSRTDGLYRNPADCSGILQCFGGDVFEYPPCSSGLVFNEQAGKCDYRDSVLECRIEADKSSLLKGCHGTSHGDFIADKSNCEQFYRCVWDRMERMQCPSGTVFNPELSVCDWPVNVPQCATLTSS